MNRKMHIILPLITIAFWIFPAISQAGKITEVPRFFDKIQMQGVVDYISPENDYIELNESRVYLADVKFEGKRRTTSITDLKGNAVNFGAIRKGSWVFVRGLTLPDETIVARDIVILPRRIENRERAKYPALSELKDWSVPGK